MILRTLQGDDLMGPGFFVFFRRLGRMPMGGPSLYDQLESIYDDERERERDEDETIAVLLMAVGVNL